MELKRIENYKLKFTNAQGKSAIIDGPKQIGGGEDGLRPMEMLLGGLAGCSSMDVLSILNKQKQQIKAYKIVINSERAKDHPKVFTKIHLIFVVKGLVDEDKLKRAISLSMEKYCSVTKMLEKNSDD